MLHGRKMGILLERSPGFLSFSLERYLLLSKRLL
jgi:hypothetical protein